jgi:FkbM family methyltransferase
MNKSTDERLSRTVRRLQRSALYRINRIARIIYSLRNKMLADAPFHAVVAGAKLRLHPRGVVAFSVWSNYRVEVDELDFLARHLQPSDVFCDVGANIGIFSLVGASRMSGSAGALRIFAFEPTPATYRTLAANVSLNRFDCIETVNAAVGAEEGTATLYLNDVWKDGLNALAKPQRGDAKVISEVEVPVVTLDTFLRSRSVSRVDYLKIDVEGAELAVLEGARLLLEASPNCIVIFECSVSNAAAFGYHPEKIMKLFREIGFQIMLFEEAGRLVPVPVNCYQGNMLAGRPEKLAQLGLMSVEK